MIKIGCCTSCFNRFCSLSESVDRIAKFGFEIVEINVSGDGLFPNEIPLKEKEKLFSIIQNNKLLLNIHIDLNYIYRRAILDKKDFFSMFEYLVDPFFEWVKILPLELITFDPLYSSFINKTFFKKIYEIFKDFIREKTKQKLRNSFSHFHREETLEVVKYSISKKGNSDLQIGIENLMPGTLTPEDFLSMKNEIGKDFGLLLDIGHANLGVENKWIGSNTLKDYILSLPIPIIDVHLSDNDGTADQHLPLGEGEIDFTLVIGALKEKNYRKGIVLEIKGNFLPEVEKALLNSKKMLEEIIKEIYGKS